MLAERLVSRAVAAVTGAEVVGVADAPDPSSPQIVLTRLPTPTAMRHMVINAAATNRIERDRPDFSFAGVGEGAGAPIRAGAAVIVGSLRRAFFAACLVARRRCTDFCDARQVGRHHRDD